MRLYSVFIYINIQGVPGGKDLTSGECSLGQTIYLFIYLLQLGCYPVAVCRQLHMFSGSDTHHQELVQL